jgi:hypothetical protein
VTETSEARRLLSLSAKLCVQVLACYQNSDEAAMRAFGSNGPHMVARDLAHGLMLFKINYPPEIPQEAPVD